jgi:hypothetical protein
MGCLRQRVTKKEKKKVTKKMVVITCYVMFYTDIDFNEWSGVLGRIEEYPKLVSFSHCLRKGFGKSFVAFL